MIKVGTVLNLLKLMLVLGIIGTILGVFRLGALTWSEGDAVAGYLGPPLRVRLEGTLYSPDQNKEGGLRTLNVKYEKQNWVFDLEKLVILSGVVSEMTVLQALRPYGLRLGGTEEVLGVLEGPEMIGKPLTIWGFLYMSHQRLMVESIETVSAGEG